MMDKGYNKFIFCAYCKKQFLDVRPLPLYIDGDSTKIECSFCGETYLVYFRQLYKSVKKEAKDGL